MLLMCSSRSYHFICVSCVMHALWVPSISLMIFLLVCATRDILFTDIRSFITCFNSFSSLWWLERMTLHLPSTCCQLPFFCNLCSRQVFNDILLFHGRFICDVCPDSADVHVVRGCLTALPAIFLLFTVHSVIFLSIQNSPPNSEFNSEVTPCIQGDSLFWYLGNVQDENSQHRVVRPLQPLLVRYIMGGEASLAFMALLFKLGE